MERKFIKKLIKKVRKKQERKYKITQKRLEEFKANSRSKVNEAFYMSRRGRN
ncbi:hypothetical protein [Alkalihalobacterium elongatum]|uniref:hypothetical protein n=1 Tax=Alkalihalobacterium elongatum TaxID=2675466 RepID=UPI001C1F9009|nr:hypothetical protein [Alkalihalobacterium elongatum]